MQSRVWGSMLIVALCSWGRHRPESSDPPMEMYILVSWVQVQHELLRCKADLISGLRTPIRSTRFMTQTCEREAHWYSSNMLLAGGVARI